MKKLFILFFVFVANALAIEHLTTENFDEKLNGKKVIIDFYADWCPPCKVVSKNLKVYKNEKSEDIVIYKVDIDDQRELIKKFNIVSLPSLVYADNGELKHLSVGVQSVEEISKNASTYLK